MCLMYLFVKFESDLLIQGELVDYIYRIKGDIWYYM